MPTAAIFSHLSGRVGSGTVSGIIQHLQEFGWDPLLIPPYATDLEIMKEVDAAICCTQPSYVPLLDGFTGPVAFHNGLALSQMKDTSFDKAARSWRLAGYDDDEIGRISAQHIAERGYQRVLAISGSNNAANGRAASLKEECEILGLGFKHTQYFVPGAVKSALAELKPSLKDPVCIWIFSDLVTPFVVSLMSGQWSHVPREIGLISVGNDESVCRVNHPQITSVFPPHIEVGRALAELATEMESPPRGGGGSEDVVSIVSGSTIVPRFSTQRVFQRAGRSVEELIPLLKAHAQSGLPLIDFLSEAGLSKSTFQRRLDEAGYASPAELVARYRLEEAERLLTKTSLSISQIADRAGFGSSRSMRRIFQKNFGVSPTDYLQKSQSGNSF